MARKGQSALCLPDNKLASGTAGDEACGWFPQPAHRLNYRTTTFTSLSGTTMTFTTCLPSM
jgi:hypothetical protein